MVLKSKGWIKKCIAVFMMIIILTPNVYCVEMSESSDSDDTTESSQVDTTSEEDTSSTSDEQSNEEALETEELETEEDSTEEITLSEETIVTASSSTEEIAPLVESKSYLNPTIESDNDYFDTSLFTGSFIYSYPIETVTGKGGLEPKVTLTYSSSSSLKGTYGSLGAGWSLNDNCIIRNVRYTPGNTSDDRFILTLDGSSYELIYVEEDGLYHTEIESFMKISRNTTNSNLFGEYWNVITSDGTTYRFGYNNDSEQRNSVEARDYVSKWWMDLVEDVNGNQIEYHYVENPRCEEIGSVYLDNITYNDGHSVIDLIFGEKTSVFDVYEHGNHINERSIITSINVLNDQNILWNYELEYEHTGSKSLLTSITKTGLNRSGFPSTVFEYDSVTRWERNDSWVPPITFSNYDNGVRLTDVNGDGLVDILYGLKTDTDTVKKNAWLNNGNGWEQTDTWIPPVFFMYGGALRKKSAGVNIVDLNGDGLPDLIGNGYSYINNGSGWTYNTEWAPPTSFHSYDFGLRFADVNGDGLVDLIQGRQPYNRPRTKYAWLNTGNGWEETSIWVPPVIFVFNTESKSGLDSGSRLTDLNGDGLVDIMGNGFSFINNGSGWERNDAWASPAGSLSRKDRGVRLADVNGDGLTDVIRAYDYNNGHDNVGAWLNTGTGWEETGTWIPPVYFSSSSFTRGSRLADVNGDGLVDILHKCPGYGSSAWINTNKDISDGYKTPNLLKTIQHRSGATTTIEYEPSTNSDNTGNDDISDLPVNVWVTSQMIRDNGIEGTGSLISTTNYSYKDGMQYYDAPEEIEFRGFGEVTVENNYSITKHAFHQDDILKGIENHTEVWDKNGNLYSSSDMEYSTQELYSDVNLILLGNESSTQFDGLTRSLNDPIGWSSYKEYDEYDDYGNPLSVTEYGDVDVAGDERYFHYEYVNDEDDWILGKTVHEWIKDSDHVNCSESWYYYDDTEDNSDLNRGLLTKVVSWNDNGDDPSVLYDYDNYGNIVEITDAKGFSQTIEYDEDHVYPVSIENSLGQIESYEYNDLGRITKITDSNGFSTDYVYDELQRISKVIRPYDNSSSPSIQYAYEQDGVVPETIITRTKINKTTNEPDVSIIQDLIGFNISNFNYSKTITVSPSSDGTLTDYQMRFKIDYEAGMQSDFDDLRFIDEQGVLLPYWIEDMEASNYSNVWIKVPVIDGTNGTTIRMYYGDQEAESLSSGYSVFDLFDDFSADTISNYNTRTIGGTHSISYDSSNERMQISSSSGGWFLVTQPVNSTTEDGFVMEFDVTLGGTHTGGGVIGANLTTKTDNIYALRHDHVSGDVIRLDIHTPSYVDGGSTTYSMAASQTKHIKIVYDGTNAKYYVDNSLKRMDQLPYVKGEFGFNDCDGTSYYDNLVVRKYVNDEPDVSTVQNPIGFTPFVSYYRTITISPSPDGTLTDYQMRFNIDYEAGMQSDFDDLRFIDEEGVLLPYWIEDMEASNYSNVWVKVPVIDGTNGTTIKMYYGDQEAESLSSGYSVFDLFDDFSADTISNYNTRTIGGTHSISYDSSNERMQISSSSGGWFLVTQPVNSATEDGFVMEFDVTLGGTHTGGGVIGANLTTEMDNYYVLRHDHVSGDVIRLDIHDPSYVDGGSTTYSMAASQAKHIKIVYDGTNTKYYVDNSLKRTDQLPYVKGEFGFNDCDGTSYYDNLVVRKYVNNEPDYNILKKSTVYDCDLNEEGSNSSFYCIDFYDGVGKITKTKYEGEDDWITQSTTYNELGLVCSTEVPHYINESGQSVTYQYDPIGRPTVITNTDNTTLNYHYELENTTITNQNGVNKTLTSDIYGNIAKVYEFNENETYVTSYSYDAMNNLVEIIPDV
jgi:YD repeat-containing protein